MFALQEQLLGDVEMCAGGGDDIERVAGGGGGGDGGEHVEAMFLGNLAGRFRVRVVYPGELHLAGGVEFGVDAGVMLPERAGAENGDFDLCHGRECASNRPELKSEMSREVAEGRPEN